MGMSIKEPKNLQPGPHIKREKKKACARVGSGDNMSVCARARVRVYSQAVAFEGLACAACLLHLSAERKCNTFFRATFFV